MKQILLILLFFVSLNSIGQKEDLVKFVKDECSDILNDTIFRKEHEEEIKKAEHYLDKGKFEKAGKEIIPIHKIYPAEKYPAQFRTVCECAMQKEKDLVNTLKRAKEYYKDEEYQKSKDTYYHYLKIFPQHRHSLKRIERINEQLVE
jgi:outer membrane protein assembly factor BamD (BamD/ComL family)